MKNKAAIPGETLYVVKILYPNGKSDYLLGEDYGKSPEKESALETEETAEEAAETAFSYRPESKEDAEAAAEKFSKRFPRLRFRVSKVKFPPVTREEVEDVLASALEDADDALAESYGDPETAKELRKNVRAFGYLLREYFPS